MLIDDYEIPERIIDKLVSIIDVIPNKDIISYAKLNHLILKGYQLNKKNASVFRQRIKKSLPTTKNIDTELRSRLTSYSLNSEIISFLSLPILEKHLNNMLALYGYEQMIIGLLLDGRKEVRALGISTSKSDETESSDEAKETAEQELVTSLEPLLETLSELIEIKDDEETTSSKNKSADNLAEVKELKKQIAQLNLELKIAKEFEKKERKLSRTLKEKTEKLQRTEQDFKTEKANLKKATLELKKTNNKLEKKASELSVGINSGIQAELKSHIHDWLLAPTAVQKYIENTTAENNDLLSLAEIVLEKQAQKDKHFGNLKTLREQLEKLITAHSNLVRARTEALSPVTELAEIEAKLEEEIISLRRALGETGNVQLTDIVTDLSIMINEATTIKEMDALASKFVRIGEMEILADSELRNLYSTYHNKQERMYDLLLANSPKATAPTSLAWKFKYSIDKKQPFVWILDGHNVLFSLRDVFGSDKQGVPGADARNKLIAAMTSLVKDAPQCEVNIFFDGPAYSQEHAAANVKITYSGGEGEHRADNAILEIVEYMQAESPDLTRVLVTDDRDLAQQAKKHKTANMRLAEFAAILVDSI